MNYDYPPLGVASRHSRQVKAEGLLIIRIGQRPISRSQPRPQSPERAEYMFMPPFQGLGLWCIPFRRALPCAELLKAFSLNLTAMASRYVELNARLQPCYSKTYFHFFLLLPYFVLFICLQNFVLLQAWTLAFNST